MVDGAGIGASPAPPRLAGEVGDDSLPSVTRLLALTDGVVAIALTLLVLQLSVPTVSEVSSYQSAQHVSSAVALGHALANEQFLDQVLTYLISFYVIGQFWLVHHRVFRHMRGHSEGLAWWNFAFLFSITLMPFSSALLGRFADNPLAVTIFAVNLLWASLTTQLVLRFGRRHHLLGDLDPREERAANIRAFGVMVILTASIVFAWTVPGLAKYFWIALLIPAQAARLWTRRHAAGAAGAP